MEDYLKGLNDKQLEAVTSIDGALLVLAGAGSGKTTVLASRIAYILQNTYTHPWNILAITFTNKAANEMRDRIGKIIGSEVKDMWVGTFHSICVKILRTCIERAGYGKDFVIYDSADSRTVVKECVRELGLDEKVFTVKGVHALISNAKNEMMDPDEFEKVYKSNPRMRKVAEIYKNYRKKLINNNALDFDDLIMLTVRILKENEDIAEKYQARFQYILVDEYQDTNDSQYELIHILAGGYGNICVVGDDDQSIYKFRGANINNILEFEKDYKHAKRIMLEQNYRSTSTILDAANAVIANNEKRMGKNLWTSKGAGEKITAYTGSSEKEEARFIAKEIEKIHKRTGTYNGCAVLYRMNAQSRAIEEAFMRESIPYRVLAGLRFYDRKEIKDVIAYLRLIYNHGDDVSLRRIINEPKRKIGNVTLDKIRAHSAEQGISDFEVISNVGLYLDLKSAAPRLKAFADMISEFRRLAGIMTIYELVLKVINDSGYMAALAAEDTVESQTRIENIKELVSVVKDYSENEEYSGTLGEFLETVTLVSDIDDYDQMQDSVVMMTVHSAKGLEFPTVFLAGLEEGLFPAQRSMMNDEDIEEERRLCYVAITRAKEKLYITKAMNRMRFGKYGPSIESRFFREIPAEYIDDVSGFGAKVVSNLEKSGLERLPERRRTIPQKKEQTPAMEKYSFRKGDRVRHRKFGDGTVVMSQTFGKDAIVVVDFDTAGTKRLMAAFAKLERV